MLNHLRFGCRDILHFCKLKCDTMNLIVKEYCFFLFRDPNDFTLLRIEGHKPFTLPGFKNGKV